MAIELRLPEQILSEAMLLSLSRRNPGYRLERSADGKLIVSPPTGFAASGGEGNLLAQMSNWADAAGLGEAYPATAGMTLPDTSIRSPDATYVTYETLRALTPQDQASAFVRVVPDVVFELVTPSDELADAEAKIDAFVASGVRAAVLLDPASKTVTISRPRAERETCSAEFVTIGPEMPGFVLDAALVFRRCKPLEQR